MRTWHGVNCASTMVSQEATIDLEGAALKP